MIHLLLVQPTFPYQLATINPLSANDVKRMIDECTEDLFRESFRGLPVTDRVIERIPQSLLVYADVKRSFSRRRTPVELRHFTGYDITAKGTISSGTESPHSALYNCYARPTAKRRSEPVSVTTIGSITCPFVRDIFIRTEQPADNALFKHVVSDESLMSSREEEHETSPVIDTGLFTFGPINYGRYKQRRQESELFETAIAVNNQDRVEAAYTDTDLSQKTRVYSSARPQLTVVFDRNQMKDDRERRLCEWWQLSLGTANQQHDSKTTVSLLDSGNYFCLYICIY